MQNLSCEESNNKNNFTLKISKKNNKMEFYKS